MNFIMSEVICPHCKNSIYDDDALLCHFCGGSLHRAGKGFISNLKYANNKGIWILIIGVLLLSFILIVIF